MTVKDAAQRTGISTKTLSNRLLRAGCVQYKTNDTPHYSELHAVLKPEEKEALLLSKQGPDPLPFPVQERKAKPAKAKAPAVDVQAIMVAVGETMKKREAALVDRFESLESTVKAHRFELGKQVDSLYSSRSTGNSGLVGLIFGSEVSLLIAAGFLMCFGAFAYQRVVCTLVGTDSWSTAAFGFVAGLVVHYAGLLNAYRKSKSPAPRYGTHPVVYWIGAFMAFECVLHACNYSAFGENATVYVAKLVMTISVPLATAALADAMLTPNPQTDESSK